MATGKLLRQLIKSGVEGNVEVFRAASEEVIKEERLKQHHLLANDLERILYGLIPDWGSGRGEVNDTTSPYRGTHKEKDAFLQAN
jgi:hypothetical protein